MMVLGFDRGRIEVKLEKTLFSPGETIKGTVFLKVKKPFEARNVRIAFRGDKMISEPQFNMHGRLTKSRRKEKVYSFSTDLEDEKEFIEGNYEYPFEIPVPENIIEKEKAPEGVMGNIFKTVKFVVGFSSYTKWQITGSVDIKGATDFHDLIKVDVKWPAGI